MIGGRRPGESEFLRWPGPSSRSGEGGLLSPNLSNGSALAVCTANSSSLFISIFNPKTIVNCLNELTSAADYNYASGSLFETTAAPGLPTGTDADYAHSKIFGTRARPADGGDEKY